MQIAKSYCTHKLWTWTLAHAKSKQTHNAYNISRMSKMSRPTTCYLNHVHTIYNVEATLSNATKSNVASTKSNVTLTLLPFLAIMSNEVFMKLRPFGKVETNWTCSIRFRLCRQDEISFDIVAENGNNVKTLSKQRSTLSNQHSTLLKESFDLQHSTMFLRHCCWCGSGFRYCRKYNIPDRLRLGHCALGCQACGELLVQPPNLQSCVFWIHCDSTRSPISAACWALITL